MSLRYPLRSGLSRLVRNCLPVIVIVAGMGVLAGLSGCDDDRPTMPANTDAWHVEDLPLLTIGVGLTAIDFDGNQGHILGGTSQKVGTDYLLLSRDPERHWVSAELADPPDNAVLLDLAAGALGLAVGGFLDQDIDPCLLYDERSFPAASIARAGVRIAAVDGDDDLMVAGGTGIGGTLWSSREPGIWAIEVTPLDTQQDGGFTDVFVGGGRALACGYDEGADTLQVALSLDTVAGVWRKVPLGAGVATRTFRCIAGTAGGAIMVGGLQGGSGQSPRAFLMLRSSAGAWSDIALPDGDLIGGVNDILPAADGAWYVACGGAGGAGLATILRVSGTTATREMTPFQGKVQQMAVDGDGVVHAVGYRSTAGLGLEQPTLWTRD